MSERATKTFLQSLTANPDSAASSLAKLLTLGMGLGQHDCGKAASAAARSSECRGTMTTTMRAQCFKTRQSTNGAVSPGIGAAARSCSHSSSILLTTEWAGRRGVSCDRRGSRSNGLGLHAWNFEAQRTAAQRVHNAQVHRPNLQEVLALLGNL